MDGLLIVILVCAAGGVLAFVGVTALTPEQSVSRLRLQALAGGEAAAQAGKGAAAPEPKAKKKRGGLLSRMMLRLWNSARSFLEGGSDDTVHRLAMAGYSSPHHAASFHGMRM